MATLATDDFTRADGAGLGANWGTVVGHGTFDILGNVANNNNVTSPSSNYYSALTWPNNHWSQATVVDVTNLSWVAVTVRQESAGADSYRGGANPLDFATSNRRIWKHIAGIRTNLATEAVAVVAGDVLRLEVVGDTITLKVNGVTSISVVDTTLTSGSPGISGRKSAGTNSPQLDAWSGGDFGNYTQGERGTRGLNRGLATGGF